MVRNKIWARPGHSVEHSMRMQKRRFCRGFSVILVFLLILSVPFQAISAAFLSLLPFGTSGTAGAAAEPGGRSFRPLET